ncbi:MAG: hypothetical protein Tsb0017_17690 [Geothermobacteraceae bacterium]
MRGLLTILFLLLTLVPARALVLDRDTVWRGELSFSEPVEVPAGVTLRVEPGSRIRFQGSGLTVLGRVHAREAEFSGAAWTGLVLRGVGVDSLLADCRVSGAATGVRVESGAPRLEGLTVENNRIGIELVRKTDATVSGCRLLRNSRVGLMLKDGATAGVVDCTFEANGRYGAYIYKSKPRRFAGNTFRDEKVALMLSHYGSDPVIEGNCLTGNDTGVMVDRAARPRLVGNEISGNRVGLHCYRRSDPQVAGNRIRDNEIGVLVAYSSYPVLHGNDLADNRLAIRLEYQSIAWERQKGEAARRQESTRGAFGSRPRQTVGESERRAAVREGFIDARDNWWGDEATRRLVDLGADGNPDFIHDGRDQATFEEGGQNWPLDRVRFAPWRGEPVPFKADAGGKP